MPEIPIPSTAEVGGSIPWMPFANVFRLTDGGFVLRYFGVRKRSLQNPRRTAAIMDPRFGAPQETWQEPPEMPSRVDGTVIEAMTAYCPDEASVTRTLAEAAKAFDEIMRAGGGSMGVLGVEGRA